MANPSTTGTEVTPPSVTIRWLAASPHFLDRDDKPRGGRPLALLAYLVIERPEGASRDELMELLWDPKPGVDASARLRNQLYELDRLLPSGILHRAGRNVSVDSGRLECDLLALREAVAERDVEAVLRLVDADCLNSAPPHGSAYLEEWAEGVRLRTRLSLYEFFSTVAAEGLALAPQTHLDVARRLVQLDPESVEAWATVIQAAGHAGVPAEGLDAAERIDQILAERDQTADPALRELLSSARGTRPR
ncbi:MAG: hypothetical protein RLN75_03320, partial [Longimicrobiales bacterium]